MKTLRMAIFAFVLAPVAGLFADTPGDNCSKQLLAEAPKIIQELKARGCQNVGVLKFRIEKGNQPVDRVGTLNGNLADRLELALILANNAQSPLGIIHDASGVAAVLPGADHRTAEGRAKLFAAKYPLAWGSQKVAPDALLIGTAKVEGISAMTVTLFLLDSKQEQPHKLSQFKIASTVTELAEAGESFVLRGVFDQGQVQLASADRAKNAHDEAYDKIKQVYEKPADYHPLSPNNATAPIALQVLYDGVAKPYEFREGCAQIPEPKQGQKVTFVLTRKARDPHTYAVTLKVNGENTIARQRFNDLQCRKWILAPQSAPIPVRGFQLDNNRAEEFRVASPQESTARAIDYGRDVGTISVVVFREAPKDLPDSTPRTDAEEDLAILMRSVVPPQAADFGTLRSKLASQLASKEETRGLIVQGDKIDQPITIVKFQEDPIPVMSGVITYYRVK